MQHCGKNCIKVRVFISYHYDELMTWNSCIIHEGRQRKCWLQYHLFRFILDRRWGLLLLPESNLSGTVSHQSKQRPVRSYRCLSVGLLNQHYFCVYNPQWVLDHWDVWGVDSYASKKRVMSEREESGEISSRGGFSRVDSPRSGQRHMCVFRERIDGRVGEAGRYQVLRWTKGGWCCIPYWRDFEQGRRTSEPAIWGTIRAPSGPEDIMNLWALEYMIMPSRRRNTVDWISIVWEDKLRA